MNQCIVTFISQTMAVKAQRLLNSFAIPSSIVNVDSKKSPRGCSYGIKISTYNLKNTETLLGKNGIEYSGVIF